MHSWTSDEPDLKFKSAFKTVDLNKKQSVYYTLTVDEFYDVYVSMLHVDYNC